MRACWGYGLPKVTVRVTERFWESRSERVKIPYVKPKQSGQDPKYHETRGTLWEVGGTTPQG